MGSKDQKKALKKEKPAKMMTIFLLLAEVLIQIIAILLSNQFNLLIVVWISLLMNIVILGAWLVFWLSSYKVKIKVKAEKQY